MQSIKFNALSLKNRLLRSNIFFFLFLTGGCSLYLDLLKKPHHGHLHVNPPTQERETMTYCSSTRGRDIVVGSGAYAAQKFLQFLKKAQRKGQRKDQRAEQSGLALVDKAVLWSLFQMNLRPDASSPMSRLQMLISFKGATDYWDFPYLYGLEKILRHYKSRHSLLTLARLLDQRNDRSVPVQEEFAKFLLAHKKKLLANKIFKKAFFKADQPLQKGESLRALSFEKIVKSKRRSSSSGVSTSPTLYLYRPLENGMRVPHNRLEIRCNVDLTPYEKGIYSLREEGEISSHAFALQDSTGGYFIGHTSQGLGNFRALGKMFLLDGRAMSPHPPPAVFCHMENFYKSAQISLVSLSTKGRDPGQYLFQLIEKKIYQAQDYRDVDLSLRSARKLFLPNPLRVIFESHRGMKSERETLLAADHPVYHGQKLGEVWAWIHNQKTLQKEVRGFILDPRGHQRPSCL